MGPSNLNPASNKNRNVNYFTRHREREREEREREREWVLVFNYTCPPRLLRICYNEDGDCDDLLASFQSS